MGILIIITRIGQAAGIGYYMIKKRCPNDVDFFMAIDKQNNKIKFYLDSNFSVEPIKTFVPNPQELIGSIPGVSMPTYWRVLMKAVKVLAMDNFPEHLDYEA